MDPLHIQTELLLEISVPTNNLKLESIQKILSKTKEQFKCASNNEEFWSQVANILWIHLKTGLTNVDDQLLCATCFFTVIPFIDNTDFYIDNLLKIIEEELKTRKANEATTKTFQVVSLMYGMFQSSFVTHSTNIDIPNIVPVIKSMVDLLTFMGCEYSQYTFLVFKTMKSLKKSCGTNLQQHIFNKENIIKLLNLNNHNWENPITGVRDLNRSVFQILLTVMDDAMYEVIVNEINGFYWNKAKYLMLSEVIECNRGESISQVSSWIDGLLNSLHKPGLVSAGADMYYAVLKKMKTENDWCKIFLSHVINIFRSTNNKAIQNFSNYWCLTTMKKFPSLGNILINELEKLNDSEHKLYSSLCVMKQANKFGIIDKNWSSTADYKETERAVLSGIEHSNNYIRMTAFEIVCVSHGKSVPTAIEYELILNFLVNNVNSDCTVLRISMLNSFSNFLTQLHSKFLNNIVKNDNRSDIESLIDFCKKVQSLVKHSLYLNGNYQRKITSVKLCELIISCLCEVPKKKKAQTRKVNITLIEFLKDKGNWLLCDDNFVAKLICLLKDPADDIRESIIKLLLNHYSTELRSSLLSSLITDALKYMRSKFFYEIGCGQSMFKLIANLVIRQKHLNAEFKSAEDIFLFGYNELISEYKLKRDTMKSIETGKQLHSFMSILLVVLEACSLNSYKIEISTIMPELLDSLEGISNQFSWEQDSSTSCDFSKINDMVQTIITDSGYNACDDNDQMKISGLQQIVLNSLWLNVKAACDLASVLITYNTNDEVMALKCLTIITHVLETSRHKGAIEAAGVALGRAIQCLTSLPEDNEVSKVPCVLLKCKLQDLISETNKMSSITRRGAGLSIMVHRIVSSDMKRSKPLFHYFMNTLLGVCNNWEEIPGKVNDGNMENQIDLPKAIYIHFMTRIVTDSSLASDLMFYSAQLAELAFGNLISPQWQIRNAALQLYGALIPRLIGQKKPSGDDEETIATVAYDELRTHSPKLWKYITEQLNKGNAVDRIQCHSNLVPILNLLASSAKRYSFEPDINDQKSMDYNLLKCLFGLLNTPIYTVRRLAAKCMFNIYKFDSIYNVLKNEECCSENMLHGCLTLLRLCHKFYSSEETYEQKFNDLKEKFGTILKSKQHSYLCNEHYEDTFINTFCFKEIQETLLELNTNKHNPGVFLWAETRMKKYINCCSWCEMPDTLNILLKQSEYEKYCQLILTRIESGNDVTTEVLLKIVSILITFENRCYSSIIWKMIYEISKKTDLHDHIDFAILVNKLDDKKFIYKLRYTIPLIAKNIAKVSNDGKISLVKLISDLSNFENSDVDMRYVAALANNELAYNFEDLLDAVKITSIKCAVIMLQDEDEDVRNLSVAFYKILTRQKAEVHPYICLNKILNGTFLNTTFSNAKTSIPELCKELSEVLNSNHVVDEFNPFANDSKNIYLETEVLQKLIQNILDV